MITMSLGRVHGQVCTKAITQRIKSIDSKIIRYDSISRNFFYLRCRFYANYSEIMQQKTIELCNSSCALEENRQRHIFTGELSVNVWPIHKFYSRNEFKISCLKLNLQIFVWLALLELFPSMQWIYFNRKRNESPPLIEDISFI